MKVGGQPDATASPCLNRNTENFLFAFRILSAMLPPFVDDLWFDLVFRFLSVPLAVLELTL